MKKKRNAQSSVELVVIFVIILVILIFIIQIYSKSEKSLSGELEAKKAKTVVDKIASAAELVFQQGIGSRVQVYISIPNNVNNINLTGKNILINLFAGGKERTVHRKLNFNISGTIPTGVGNQGLYFESQEDFVFVETVSDLTPPTITSTSPSGTTNDNTPELSATTDEAATCKYDTTDNIYASMSNTFTGTETSHTATVGPLSDGDHTYYVKCIDVFEHAMSTSEIISFTIDTAPPSTITNLANQSRGVTWIYWTWTNPSIDFDSSLIYIDGINVANSSVSTYNATGFSQNENHTIKVHTQDSVGNINDTDVNSTALTSQIIEYSGTPQTISCVKEGGPVSCDSDLSVAGLSTSDCTPSSCGYVNLGSSDDSYAQLEFGDLSIPLSNIFEANVTIEYEDEKSSFDSQEIKCYDGNDYVKFNNPTVTTSETTQIFNINLSQCISPYTTANDIKLRFGQFSPNSDSGKIYVDYVLVKVWAYED